MKRLAITAVLFLLIVFSLTSFAFAQPVNIVVDGNKLFLEQPVITLYNHTLIPLRDISAALDAKVRYDEPSKTIFINKDGMRVIVALGSLRSYINNQPYILQLEPQLINGKTYVPLRFVSEALGAQVVYEKTTQTIDITSKPSITNESMVVEDELTKVHFIDVGYGDCIYIELPGGEDILIDSGSEKYTDKVIKYLKDQGVEDIELLIATHPHEDHIGAIPAIMNSIPIREVIDNGVSTSHQHYKEYDKAVRGIRNTKYKAIRKFNNATLQIIKPSEVFMNDYNNSSLGVRLDLGELKFFFAGDFGTSVESDILQKYKDIKSDILKVGHHGSSDATSERFIKNVAPSIAVISVGDNDYGFPSEKVIARLQSNGVKVYNTAINGNIVIKTDGKNYTVVTEKGREMDIITKPKPDYTEDRGLVVASDEEEIYHEPNCREIRNLNVENQIWFDSGLEARGEGYSKCNICNPN